MKVLGLGLLLAAAAPALTPGTTSLKVQFPQPVHVNGTWLPAGEYTIRTISNGGDTPLLAIEGGDGKSVLAPARRDAMPGSSPEMHAGAVLRERGGVLRLAEVKFAGQASVFVVFD
jgi:hypothetical protein